MQTAERTIYNSEDVNNFFSMGSGYDTIGDAYRLENPACEIPDGLTLVCVRVGDRALEAEVLPELAE
ncbi:MAG: hypothetical protein HC838_12055 [Spirulinaceae cyanobacterium RM2_2_10]|nr:hypothetical protein [Spirulinaceae cyanobacterium RM2_2_10]